MVLPAPAAHDESAEAERALLDRLRLILRLGSAGVLVLIDEARPERLGPFVRALLSVEPELQVHVNALRLPSVPPGSAVVLLPDLAHADWLNLERPLFAHRALRVLLFCDHATAKGLAQRAPDFFHWISHRFVLPSGAWRPAVLGLQAAAAAGAPGIAWKGGDLDEAFREAFPAGQRIKLSAALPYEFLLEFMRAVSDVWFELHDIDGIFRLRRVHWAMAEAGRVGRVVLREPSVEARWLWPVAGRALAPVEACRMLEEAGAANAGALAALLDLEPEAVADAAAVLKASMGESALSASLWEQDDPGVAIGRMTLEMNLDVDPKAPLRWRAGQEICLGYDRDDVVQAVQQGAWSRAASAAAQAGDFSVAEGWARRSLEQGEEPVIAATVLGRVLRELGRLSEAEEVLRGALATHAESAPGMTQLLGALGLVLFDRGELGYARTYLEASVRAHRKSSGADQDSHVAQTLSALARVLLRQGDVAGARTNLNQALHLQRKVFGRRGHPEIAATLYLLAFVLQQQGELDGARRRYEEAIWMNTEFFGTDEQPDIAVTLCELGRLLDKQGKLDEAREHLEHALRIQRKLFGGDDNRPVVTSLHTLALVLMHQGAFKETRELLEHVLTIQLGLSQNEGRPDIADTLRALGSVSFAEGALEAARTYFKTALELRENGSPELERRLDAASTEQDFAQVLRQLGARQGAMKHLTHAHAMLLELVGPDDPRTQEAAALLASGA